MYVLFDEAGKFLGGRVLSEAESSAQVELDSGKRVKVKAANILLRFEKPAPAELIAEARGLAASMDLDLAWEFADEDEFGFADLARDYFSDKPTLAQQAGALFALFEAPHYFRRAGKGRFKKAPAEIVQQALVAIEKKKAQQAQIAEWAAALADGQCPPAIREQLYKILFKPDKNAPEYKAVVDASRSAHRAPLELLERAGAIDSPYEFHWKRFLFDNFPKGTGFGALEAPPIADVLPLAEGVRAFSIDDSQTTEIDDALSVQGVGSGTVTVGIHIAAPALAIAPQGAVDQVARARMSTVYMPGHKITMLPDAVVQTYTLLDGGERPALSLYVRFNEETLDIISTETRIERVFIALNLRHDQLDEVIDHAWLTQPDGSPAPPEVEALRVPLSFLFRLAKHLKAGREAMRGKPETFSRPDYNFRLQGVTGDEPTGHEQVQISSRRRGSPLDLIVAEAMILANSTWGAWLGDLGVPALYRSQASLAPGVKVRMGTKSLPHAGLGVKSYAWSTSPLRRYTDLVNQWQIIAAARHGRTAALAAPFKPKDSELFSILSGFDSAYSSYNAYQAGMERFWTLKYLQQQNIQELDAALIKDGGAGDTLVRADALPLVLPVLGAQGLPRGSRVRVRLGDIDLIALAVNATVVEHLDPNSTPQTLDDTESDDEVAAAGPLAIAVDLSEGEAETGAPAASTTP